MAVRHLLKKLSLQGRTSRAGVSGVVLAWCSGSVFRLGSGWCSRPGVSAECGMGYPLRRLVRPGSGSALPRCHPGQDRHEALRLRVPLSGREQGFRIGQRVGWFGDGEELAAYRE